MRVGKVEPAPRPWHVWKDKAVLPWALDTLAHNKRSSVLFTCPFNFWAFQTQGIHEPGVVFLVFLKAQMIFPCQELLQMAFCWGDQDPSSCSQNLQVGRSWHSPVLPMQSLQASSFCINLLILTKLYAGEIPASSNSFFWSCWVHLMQFLLLS